MREVEKVCIKMSITPFVLPPKTFSTRDASKAETESLERSFILKKNLLDDFIQALRFSLKTFS
jgi:hypothetical protein